MNKIKLITYLFFSITLLIGCSKDEVQEQEDTYAYAPRILGGDVAVSPNPAIFPVPNTVLVLKQGSNFSFNSLQFAPAGKVYVIWKVNDVQVATGEKYTFQASSIGNFRIRVEATFNETTVSRFKDISVTP